MPAAGWSLFLVFAGLLAVAPFLPLTLGGGGSEAMAADVGDALPILVVAAGAAIAGLAGRQGYGTGLAFGGGAVVVFAVALSFVVRVVVLLFELASELDESVVPGPGVLAFGAAAVVGLLTVVPAVGAALAPGEDRIHPLLGVTGLVGSGLYLLGVFQPALEGEPFFSGDLWVDASVVILIAALAGAGILVATARTGEACAFLGGVMLWPAGTWLGTLGDERSAFDTASAGWTEATLGLTLCLVVAVVGTFGAGTRLVRAGGLDRRVPARNQGALVVGVAIVAVLALVGLVEDDGPSWDGGTSLDGTDVGSFDEPQFDFSEDELVDDGFVEDGFVEDEFTGDGCPPPDYDCVDD